MSDVRINRYSGFFEWLFCMKYQGAIDSNYEYSHVYSRSFEGILKKIKRRVPDFDLAKAEDMKGVSYISGQYLLYKWSNNVA
jgi:hypothetical protein